MKALTVCQPYAELIARGAKSVENRTWFTPYRGLLLIHAGKSKSWMDPGDERRYGPLTFGAVVAVAELVACVHIDVTWPPEYQADLASEHANGPWCWILRKVRRLTPIACPGAQGLWLPPDDVVTEVRRQALELWGARA